MLRGSVSEIALAHRRHVKDFEGDGVLLYFDRARTAFRQETSQPEPGKAAELQAALALNDPLSRPPARAS